MIPGFTALHPGLYAIARYRGLRTSITIHVWPSRAPNFYKPDICIFDLDPSGDAADKRQLDVLCRGALDFLLLFTIHHLPFTIYGFYVGKLLGVST